MEHEHVTHHHSDTKKREDFSLSVAIVIAGAIIGGAIIFTHKDAPIAQVQAGETVKQQEAGDTTTAPVEELALKPTDHILGNPHADVVFIEYSDTECPFCKRFHESMVEIMNENGKTGQVAWVYRHFPLDQLHPKARKEAEALECANELGGNDAFWKYTNRIFAVTPANNGLDAGELPNIAEYVGLDVPKFTECLDSGKFASRVQSDFVSGVNIGIHGTPYTIVWNRKTGKQMPINGALPLANIKAVLSIVTGNQAAN